MKISDMSLTELKELYETPEFDALDTESRLEVLGRIVDERCQREYKEGLLKPLTEVYKPTEEEDSE